MKSRKVKSRASGRPAPAGPRGPRRPPPQDKTRRRGPKGERTRLELKRAGSSVLERLGYRQMKVADVTAEAGVSFGLFHHYFPNLKAMTIEILTDYLEGLSRSTLQGRLAGEDRYERVRSGVMLAETLYREHPGLMRCLMQVTDDEPEFADVWHHFLEEQSRRLAARMPSMFPQGELSEEEACLVARTLMTMVQGVLYDYYVASGRERGPLGAEELVDALTVLVNRAFFLADPSLGRVRAFPALLTMRLEAGPESPRKDSPGEGNP